MSHCHDDTEIALKTVEKSQNDKTISKTEPSPLNSLDQGIPTSTKETLAESKSIEKEASSDNKPVETLEKEDVKTVNDPQDSKNVDNDQALSKKSETTNKQEVVSKKEISNEQEIETSKENMHDQKVKDEQTSSKNTEIDSEPKVNTLKPDDPNDLTDVDTKSGPESTDNDKEMKTDQDSKLEDATTTVARSKEEELVSKEKTDTEKKPAVSKAETDAKSQSMNDHSMDIDSVPESNETSEAPPSNSSHSSATQLAVIVDLKAMILDCSKKFTHYEEITLAKVLPESDCKDGVIRPNFFDDNNALFWEAVERWRTMNLSSSDIHVSTHLSRFEIITRIFEKYGSFYSEQMNKRKRTIDHPQNEVSSEKEPERKISRIRFTVGDKTSQDEPSTPRADSSQQSRYTGRTSSLRPVTRSGRRSRSRNNNDEQ